MIYVVYCKDKNVITEIMFYTTKEADAKTITHHMNEEIGTIYKEYCYKPLESISDDEEEEQMIITSDDYIGLSKLEHSKFEDVMRIIKRNRGYKLIKGEQAPNSYYNEDQIKKVNRENIKIVVANKEKSE